MAINKGREWDKLWRLISKSDPSVSLDSEENQALASLIQESSERLNRALVEMDTLQSEISMLVEAGRETSNLIRHHISILSEVASSRETNLRTLLQLCSSLPVLERVEDRSPPELVVQTAATGGQAAEPVPWPEGQG